MTSPVQLALMVTPLAAYFYLLALWQAGRHPRVVAGAVDLWLLALGLGGLVVFGPLGQFVARTLFGRAGPLDWLFLVLVGFLVVARLARRSSRRLVIYHVDAEALDAALRDVLGAGRVHPRPWRLRGSDAHPAASASTTPRGGRPRSSRLSGHEPDALIGDSRPRAQGPASP